MTRQSRTLLIIGLVAIIGITALVLMADRYRKMVPLKSVADVEAARTAPKELPIRGEATQGGTDLGEGPSSPESSEAAAPEERGAVNTVAGDGDLTASEAWRTVEGFMVVRRVVQEKIRENEKVCAGALDEETGKLRERMPEGVFIPLNMFLIELSVAKHEALGRAGLSSDDYEAAREAIESWWDGGSLDDPTLVEVLESRRVELDPLDLGRFRIYDFRP